MERLNGLAELASEKENGQRKNPLPTRANHRPGSRSKSPGHLAAGTM